MIKIARRIRQVRSNTTSKGIPLLNLNSVADITQVNESLNKIDELLTSVGDNEEIQQKFEEIKQQIQQINEELDTIQGVGGETGTSITQLKNDLQKLTQNVTELSSKLEEAKKDLNTQIGQNTSQITTHENKKISDLNGVHGLEYLESQQALQVTKQNGQKELIKSGIDSEALFNEYTQGLEEIILKVGR